MKPSTPGFPDAAAQLHAETAELIHAISKTLTAAYGHLEHWPDSAVLLNSIKACHRNLRSLRVRLDERLRREVGTDVSTPYFGTKEKTR